MPSSPPSHASPPFSATRSPTLSPSSSTSISRSTSLNRNHPGAINRSSSIGSRPRPPGPSPFSLPSAISPMPERYASDPLPGWASRDNSPMVSPNQEGAATGGAGGTWPYSTANSSQSSVVSNITSATQRTIDPTFGMSAGNTIDKPDYSEAKIVVAMVGLPARGKSYLSNKLMRYLLWLEYEASQSELTIPHLLLCLDYQSIHKTELILIQLKQVFNVGQLRRKKYRKMAESTGEKADQSANFFDANNADASKEREAMAAECLEDLISWLKAGGNVGIHDATNTTRKRRQALVDRIKREPGLTLFFIESICTDPATIEANIAVKVASGDPDYDGQDKIQAEADFRARIRHYEDKYEPLDETLDKEVTFCKMVNVGQHVTCNRIDGYLQSRIAFYLMNLHLTPRSIFFTRHGESQYNVDGQIGGDAPLSKQGEQYMRALPSLIKEKFGDRPLTVWTSTLRRTIQTASLLPYEKLTWKSLDELDAGVCDGMTYEEIEEYYPEDYAARDDDKFNYRYRGGESYRDVVIRLEPVIIELERQENILVVCHQAVLRCLYAYFHNLSQEELPYLKIPLHTVIKLTPKAYGCLEERYELPIEAVDTNRVRPPTAKVLEAVKRDRNEGVSPSTTRPPSAIPPEWST